MYSSNTLVEVTKKLEYIKTIDGIRYYKSVDVDSALAIFIKPFDLKNSVVDFGEANEKIKCAFVQIGRWEKPSVVTIESLREA